MPDIDKHIEKLIEMLQSPKASKRYEACEYLRVAPTITTEAITALQNALNDPNAEVVDAARRALSVQHAPKPLREPPQIVPPEQTSATEHASLYVVLGLCGYITGGVIIKEFGHLHYPVIIGAILILSSMVLWFCAIWGKFTSSLHIVIPIIMSIIIGLYTIVYFDTSPGVIAAILALILLSFLSGYFFRADVVTSDQPRNWMMKSSITSLILFYSIMLATWRLDCAFPDQWCNTSLEILIFFYALCLPVTIVAPITGLCVEFFTRLGFKIRHRLQSS